MVVGGWILGRRRSLVIKTVLMSRIKDDYEVNTTSKPTLATIRIKLGYKKEQKNLVMATRQVAYKRGGISRFR